MTAYSLTLYTISYKRFHLNDRIEIILIMGSEEIMQMVYMDCPEPDGEGLQTWILNLLLILGKLYMETTD